MKSAIVLLLASLSLNASAASIQEVANQFVGKYKVSSVECSFEGAERGYIKVEKDRKGTRAGLVINLYGEDASGLTIYEKNAITPGYASSLLKHEAREVSYTGHSITNTFTLHYKDGSKKMGSRIVLAKSATGNRVRYKEYSGDGKLADECVLYRAQ